MGNTLSTETKAKPKVGSSDHLQSWEKKLHEAAGRGFEDVVVRILSWPEVKDLGRVHWVNAEAPLHAAVRYNKTNIIRILLESGINVNSRVVYRDVDSCTALHLAILSKSQMAVVKLLLEMGADPELSGRWNDLAGTPLDWAKKKEFADAVAVLQEHAGDFCLDLQSVEGIICSPPQLSRRRNC
jgi:hypothetical protein